MNQERLQSGLKVIAPGPWQVRAKTFVAVGHETANKGDAAGKKLRRDTADANLLANMELGVHADAAPGRHTSDEVP